MFRAHVLITRRSKLHYTASGIITPIGGRLVHETATYRCDDTRDCNKLHFEEKKHGELIPCLKYSVPIFVE